MVDATDGVLGIDWIDGQSVRKLLPGGTEDDGPDDPENQNDTQAGSYNDLKEYGVSVGS